MNILIVEQPVNNRGDESAHRAFVEKLSQTYPDANIKILFFEKLPIEVDEMRVERNNVEYVNIPVRHKTFAPHRMIKMFMMFNASFLLGTLPIIRKIKKLYKEADYIVCAPGGIDMGGFQNWVHIALLELAKKMNKKVIYFARSIGPFPTSTMFNRLFKRKSIELLSYFSFISLRDKKSQELAASLGISFVPTIDSAFLHYSREEIPQSFKDALEGSPYMVLVPNSLAWHHSFRQYTQQDFFEFWLKLTNTLLNKYPELKIAMLPQTVSYGYAASLDDGYKYFCRIKDASSEPRRVIVLEEKYGSNIQQNIISQAAFLIGARYHSIIFSINQNTPFVSLCYEHKMKGVTGMLGFGDIDLLTLFNGENLTEERINNFIKEIMKASLNAEQDIKGTEKARIIASNGFDKLIEFFKSQENHED